MDMDTLCSALEHTLNPDMDARRQAEAALNDVAKFLEGMYIRRLCPRLYPGDNLAPEIVETRGRAMRIAESRGNPHRVDHVSSATAIRPPFVAVTRVCDPDAAHPPSLPVGRSGKCDPRRRVPAAEQR